VNGRILPRPLCLVNPNAHPKEIGTMATHKGPAKAAGKTLSKESSPKAAKSAAASALAQTPKGKGGKK